jgi:hypothetical protein
MAAHAAISNRIRKRFKITRIAVSHPVRTAHRPPPAQGTLERSQLFCKADGVDLTAEKALLCSR